MTFIIISGTPGTNKNKLAKLICKELKFKYVDLEEFLKKNKLYEGFDKKKDCNIVDIPRMERKLKEFVIDNQEKNLIMSSHIIHLISPDFVDLCVISKNNLKQIQSVLKKRKYKKEKVEENIQAEIFDNCLIEAINMGHKVVVVDGGNKKLKEEVSKIARVLHSL